MEEDKKIEDLHTEETPNEQEEDDDPASNLTYYVEEFTKNLISYMNFEDTQDEKKADAVRWAYASLLYLEEESKEIRKMMRSKFKIKDAEIKVWLSVQEKEQENNARPDNVSQVNSEPVDIDKQNS